MKPTIRKDLILTADTLRFLFHLAVLAGGLILMVTITLDTLETFSYTENQRYLSLQLWVCIAFIFDVLFDSLFSPRHFRYIFSHIISLLVCVPWLNILMAFHIDTEPHLAFLLRVLPMVRAAVVVGEVSGSMRHNAIKSMFTGYLTLLLSIVYFSSVMFYVEEHDVNSMVHSFRSAIYWSLMNMTTAGSNIPEVTPVGKILSSLLSGLGLILFPVFTVYISDALTHASKKAENP